MSDQQTLPSRRDAESTRKETSVVRRVLGHGTGPLGALAVGLVSAAAGLLLGVSVSSAQNHGYTDDHDLATIVKDRQATVVSLEEQTDELDARVRKLMEASFRTNPDSVQIPLSRSEVTGPGLEVTLSDAANEFIPDEGATVNDLVVHQQDVDAVVNALWRGGAEAIAVQGVRLAADTPVRCVGNVILVGTRSYAPPYVISAIGDPQALSASLDRDERISDYRYYAAKYQMGWSVASLESMVLPPATEVLTQGLATPLTQ